MQLATRIVRSPTRVSKRASDRQPVVDVPAAAFVRVPIIARVGFVFHMVGVVRFVAIIAAVVLVMLEDVNRRAFAGCGVASGGECARDGSEDDEKDVVHHLCASA